MKPVSLGESQAYCQQQARKNARSFYFASVALPRKKKLAAYAVYAFCRYADDVVDSGNDHVAEKLHQLNHEFDQIVDGAKNDLPFSTAFAWAIKEYKIPKKPFFDLLEGVAMDTTTVRIADWPALENYCYHVASVVGLIMASIFECRDERDLEHAIELGIAMQLTNIIRDVGEDWRMNRVYLPKTEMEDYHISEANLQSQKLTPEWTQFLQFQIARAREYYQMSEKGIASLKNDGSQLTVWLMRHVYAGILSEVEKNQYNVFSKRASTSLPAKMRLAFKAWQDHRLRND